MHKHLGILLTYNLDWSPQVHTVIMKGNRKLGVLRRLFFLSTKENTGEVVKSDGKISN